MSVTRSCAWCRGGIPATARADSRYCGKVCRQAAHRAKLERSPLQLTDRPARLAYADPPYPGMSGLYRGHVDYGGEVDHGELLERLAAYDGWALSTSAAALPAVLELAATRERRRVRVAAWVRGPARPHATARVLNAWEPVLYVPAPRRPGVQVQDALVGPTPRRRATLPTAVIGAKPPAFCGWVFGLLGAVPGDELADLFPGSGIVTRSWRLWSGLEPHATGTDGWQLELMP